MYSNILENQIKQLNSCIDTMCTTDSTIILHTSRRMVSDYLFEIYRYNVERLHVKESKGDFLC